MKNIDYFVGKILQGNSKDILKSIPKDSVDMVVTSPPYDNLRDYTGEVVWDFEAFKKIAKQLYRVMAPGGVVVWVVGDQIDKGGKTLTSYKQALFFQKIGFKVFDVIIYEKAGSGPPHPNRYFNSFEYMFVLSKGTPKTINLLRDKPNKWANHSTYSDVTRREKDGSLTKKGKKVVNEFGVRTNIWRYANGKGFATKDEIAYEHPAIFPEKLAADHILAWSNENDIVLDPFGGSGTVAKIATQLNRRWIHIDVSEEYCKIAEKRHGLQACNTEQ